MPVAPVYVASCPFLNPFSVADEFEGVNVAVVVPSYTLERFVMEPPVNVREAGLTVIAVVFPVALVMEKSPATAPVA